MNQADHYASPGKPVPEQRGRAPNLFLVELDPQAIVDGVRYDGNYLADDVTACGTMRETCPVCEVGHLQLVLRQKNVRVAHLFCIECTRCFGALLPDGTPALAD